MLTASELEAFLHEMNPSAEVLIDGMEIKAILSIDEKDSNKIWPEVKVNLVSTRRDDDMDSDNEKLEVFCIWPLSKGTKNG